MEDLIRMSQSSHLTAVLRRAYRLPAQNKYRTIALNGSYECNVPQEHVPSRHATKLHLLLQTASMEIYEVHWNCSLEPKLELASMLCKAWWM